MTMVRGALTCPSFESLDAVVPVAELQLRGVKAPGAIPKDCRFTGHAIAVKPVRSTEGPLA